VKLTHSRHRRRWARWALLLLVPGVLLSGTALAQGLPAEEKFRSGSRVSVGANETLSDDLYASAGQIDIAGTVQGDLIAAGGDINVTDRSAEISCSPAVR